MNTSYDSTSANEWEARLIEYSIGTLSAEAAAEFEQSLEECRTHVKLAGQYTQALGWMGLGAEPVEPPSGSKERLMSRIALLPQEQKSASSATAPQALQETAAPHIALPAVTHVSASPKEEVERTPIDFTAARERKGLSRNVLAISSIAAALILLVGAFLLITTLRQPDNFSGYKAVALQAQPQGVEYASSAVVLMTKPQANTAVLVADNLQTPDPGKVYELWLLPKGFSQDPSVKPVPLTVFTTANGSARQQVTAPGNWEDYLGLAVTVENGPNMATSPCCDPVLTALYNRQ